MAVIIALSLVGLIGFMGLALDLGKLFVAKSELQNSADACALAAARELTGANEKQLELAKAAGIATGRLHDVLFQGEAITEDFHDLKVGFSKDLYDAPYDGEDEPLAMRFA
ncbi:MAG TPA: pilus assembly protein TadG-related protein, partial [Nitrosomonas halophila]|nr:pilus assembly protein TadG-related protein [Nitrosomonas halophila]